MNEIQSLALVMPRPGGCRPFGFWLALQMKNGGAASGGLVAAWEGSLANGLEHGTLAGAFVAEDGDAWKVDLLTAEKGLGAVYGLEDTAGAALEDLLVDCMDDHCGGLWGSGEEGKGGYGGVVGMGSAV